MKFAADRMLGRLAKWLRILGYDTIYDGNMDADSVSAYLREGRIVLTRGRRFKKASLKGIVWIVDDQVDQQLRQLVNENRISTEGEAKLLLCSRCNTRLQQAIRKEAEGRVPEYVIHSQQRLLMCPSCHRFYWRGTHLKRMDDYIASRVISSKSDGSPSGASNGESS